MFVILCGDALLTLQALQVVVAVGLGSAGGYLALAPHGFKAFPYLVANIACLLYTSDAADE